MSWRCPTHFLYPCLYTIHFTIWYTNYCKKIAKHLRISEKKCTLAASFLQKHTKNRTKTLQKHTKIQTKLLQKRRGGERLKLLAIGYWLLARIGKMRQWDTETATLLKTKNRLSTAYPPLIHPIKLYLIWVQNCYLETTKVLKFPKIFAYLRKKPYLCTLFVQWHSTQQAKDVHSPSANPCRKLQHSNRVVTEW